MLLGIQHWYCCLAPIEFGGLTACLVNPFFAAFFVPMDVFNGAWLLNGGTVGDLRYSIFIGIFQMEEGDLVIGEDATIHGYFLAPLVWTPILAFSLSDAGACPDGCYFKNPGFTP